VNQETTVETTEELTQAEQVADFATQTGFYEFLERTLFKGIIGYTIHPLHIVVLLVLWVGLMVWHNTVFELVGGNYTNGLSAMAASIVLLEQTRQHREAKKLHRESHRLLEEVRKLIRPASPAQ
jgi:hypothetical protein